MPSRRWRYAPITALCTALGAALGAVVGGVWIISGLSGGISAPSMPGPAPAVSAPAASAVPAASPSRIASVPPAAAAPAPADPARAGAVTRRVLRAGRPALLSGVLSAPSSDDPVAIGRRFLDTQPEVLAGVDPRALVLERSVALPRGHMLHYAQEHDGLEVVGGDTWVRLDEQGRVRWVSSDARPSSELAALAPELARGPVLSERDAVAALGRGAGYRREVLDAVDPAAAARLVIYPLPGGLGGAQPLRLAWAVELPGELRDARMRKLRGHVDAGTGAIYAFDDLVRRQAEPVCPGAQDAFVYDANPVDGALACVSLADYLTPDSTSLANADVAVQNCIDRKGCRDFGDERYHFCDFEATAGADQAGHYTEYSFLSDTDPEDGFAEVQMFYHVNRGLEVARSLGGFDNLDARPLTAVVNFRLPSFADTSTCTADSYAGSEALAVFDNAAFVPAEGLLPGFPERDAILFGQGMTSDFAYDGDVVYHELGHAIMAKIAPELPSAYFDGLGLNTMPGGMHEGYADLMTVFVTDDPEIGEYASKAFGGGTGGIRNVDNPATCPEWLTGEVHDDSLPFTGAFWAARELVGTTAETRAGFDRAVFAAQRTLGEFDDFGTAALKTLAELELELDPAAASTAEGVFAARGLLPSADQEACNDRVLDANELDVPYLYLWGMGQPGEINQVPAPVQFRYELPERASAIELDIGLSVADSDPFLPGEELEPAMALLALGSESPIEWSFVGDDVVANASHEANVKFSDLPGEPGLMRGTVSVKGPFEPGVYHLQLANRGPTWVVADLSIGHQRYVRGDGGCQVAPGGRVRNTAGALLLVLSMIALFVRWRRSAGRMRRIKRPDDH